jgi:hypothetical protein
VTRWVEELKTLGIPRPMMEERPTIDQ